MLLSSLRETKVFGFRGKYGCTPETKAYGFQGDPSSTEGKTAQSMQWKIQYQSGWEAQSVNPTFSLVEAVNSRTSYGKRASMSGARAGHMSTRQRITNRKEDCSFHKYKLSTNLDVKPVRIPFHWRPINRGEDCSFQLLEGSVPISMRSQQTKSVDCGRFLCQNVRKPSGDRGEPSTTEGKTAHSNWWKVQYQSGRETQPDHDNTLSVTEGKTAHSTKWKVQYQSGRVI